MDEKEKQAQNIEQKDKQPNVAARGGAEKDSRDGIVSATASLREEIARIVRGEDSDASLILGPHWVERDGQRALVVRAFRPGATEASILWRGNPAQAMTEIHSGGVFEAFAPASALALRKGETLGSHGGAEAAKSQSLSTPVAVLGDSRLPSPAEYRLQFRFADRYGAAAARHKCVVGEGSRAVGTDCGSQRHLVLPRSGSSSESTV